MTPDTSFLYPRLQSLRQPLAGASRGPGSARLSPFLRGSLEAVATMAALVGFGCGWAALAGEIPTPLDPAPQSPWITSSKPVPSPKHESSPTAAHYPPPGAGPCQTAQAPAYRCGNVVDRRLQRPARRVLRRAHANSMVDRGTS